MSRTAVPIERKEKLGNPGKRAIPRAPQGGVTGIPSAAGLRLGKEGLAAWRRIWTTWRSLGSQRQWRNREVERQYLDCFSAAKLELPAVRNSQGTLFF